MTLQEQLNKMDHDGLLKVAVVLEDRVMAKQAAEEFRSIGRDLADVMAKEAGVTSFLSKAYAGAARAVGKARGAMKQVSPTRGAVSKSFGQRAGEAAKAIAGEVKTSPELRKSLIGLGAAGTVGGMGYAAGRRSK